MTQTGPVPELGAGPSFFRRRGVRFTLVATRAARALHKAWRQSVLHLEHCGHDDCPLHWELALGFLAQNGVFKEAVRGDSP